MSIEPSKLYNNQILKKGLKMAANNSALFAAGTSLALSTVARPIAIALTPKTDEENKKYAITKSFASSLVGFGITLLATTPVSKAISKINENPSEYLKNQTIENLKNSDTLLGSKKYSFATQLFKLGLGFFMAVPKSFLTSKMIAPLMKKMKKPDPKKDENKEKHIENAQKIPFTANLYDKYTDSLARGIGKIMDTKPVQNLADKFHKTNFELHMMNLTDVVTTGAFVIKNMKDKNIDEKRKKVLSINSILSTGLCILGGLGLNKALDKPVNKFTENFKKVNKNSPDLAKYLEGIRVAKSTLILGGIYYILIPVISTFFAERIEKVISDKNPFNYSFLKSDAGCLHNGQMKSEGSSSPS